MSRHTVHRTGITAVTMAAWLLLAGASGRAPVLHPDRLVILSTTDVKGKTSPCGCSTPKGGFARRASFADSVRAEYGQVVVVDNGGWMPEHSINQETGGFMMDAMKTIGVEVVNVGDAELRFGRAYLEQQAKRTGLPLVSANLMDPKTKRPLFAPYRIVRTGAVTAGFFGLMSPTAPLGTVEDSVRVEDPAIAAKRTIAELRKKGATVVVLLSQLGKVETEDLVSVAPGIDAALVGRNTPLLQKGRTVRNTVVCYGGEQSHYMCRTTMVLDAGRHATTGEAEAVMLGPQVGEHPEIQALVKGYEDQLNEKLRRQESQSSVLPASPVPADPGAAHYVGSEVCVRCHVDEGAQWETTAHSAAWETLQHVKKDATPACIPCHVVGFRQPGGFVSAATTPARVDVQCENCHGMGSEHDALSGSMQVTEQTCVGCHHGEHDAEFSFAQKLPKIVHTNRSGETLAAKKVKGPEDAAKAGEMLKSHGAGVPD